MAARRPRIKRPATKRHRQANSGLPRGQSPRSPRSSAEQALASRRRQRRRQHAERQRRQRRHELATSAPALALKPVEAAEPPPFEISAAPPASPELPPAPELVAATEAPGQVSSEKKSAEKRPRFKHGLSPSVRQARRGEVVLEFAGETTPDPSPGGAPADAPQARRILTSLLFASPEPLTLQRLSALTGGLTAECLLALLDDVASAVEPLGLQVAEVAGGFQMATAPESAEWLWRLGRRRTRQPLTQAALETLAIVAYKQPVAKRDVDAIRGVESGALLRHLVELEFIEIAGRDETPGRPLLYITTKRFLKTFGLASVSDLPSMGELRELFGERERQRSVQEAEAAAERRRLEREAGLERISRDARQAAEDAAAFRHLERAGGQQPDLFEEGEEKPEG